MERGQGERTGEAGRRASVRAGRGWDPQRARDWELETEATRLLRENPATRSIRTCCRTRNDGGGNESAYCRRMQTTRRRRPGRSPAWTKRIVSWRMPDSPAKSRPASCSSRRTRGATKTSAVCSASAVGRRGIGSIARAAKFPWRSEADSARRYGTRSGSKRRRCSSNASRSVSEAR